MKNSSFSTAQIIKAAFPHTVPILFGYLSIGIAFGLLFQNAGYNALWTLFMCLVVYSGSMQFIAVGMMAAGLGVVEVALMSFLVNVRYMFYGLSFLGKWDHMGWRKYYLIFGLTDETYSVFCSVKVPEGMEEKRFLTAISAMNHCYWTFGSVLGCVAGSLITFDTTGMDFAMTALFVVIFIEQWREYSTHTPAFLGIGATLLALMIFGTENLAVPAMILITILLFAVRRPIESKLITPEGSQENSQANTQETGGEGK